jgi:hypothetical protein
MASYKYICLGGGNASGYFAKELVARGLLPGELCMVTSEAVLMLAVPASLHGYCLTPFYFQVVAYERPALSKAFLAPIGANKLLLLLLLLLVVVGFQTVTTSA